VFLHLKAGAVEQSVVAVTRPVSAVDCDTADSNVQC